MVHRIRVRRSTTIKLKIRIKIISNKRLTLGFICTKYATRIIGFSKVLGLKKRYLKMLEWRTLVSLRNNIGIHPLPRF